jgi:hypothetical protein
MMAALTMSKQVLCIVFVSVVAILAFSSTPLVFARSSAQRPQYQDVPYEQLISNRFTFQGPAIANWPVIDVAPSSVHSVQASSLRASANTAVSDRILVDSIGLKATPNSDGPSVWLLTNSSLYFYDGVANSLTRFDTIPGVNITIEPSTRMEAAAQPAAGTESLFLVSSKTIVDCRFISSSIQFVSCAFTAVPANPAFQQVADIACTNSADGCLIATKTGGVFMYNAVKYTMSAFETPISLDDAPIFFAVAVRANSITETPLTVAVATHKHFAIQRNGIWRKEWTISIAQGVNNEQAQSITHLQFMEDGALALVMPDSVYVQDPDLRTYERIGTRSGLPYNDTKAVTAGRVMVPNSDGHMRKVWTGTPAGAIRIDQNINNSCIMCRQEQRSFRYFFGSRWLPTQTAVPSTNSVLFASASFSGNDVWLLTAQGLSQISVVNMTLAQKAAHYQAMVYPRHDRFGLTSECSLKEFGNLNTYELESSDNDGLWTSMYGVSQALRYACTRTAEAKADAWHALEGLQLLNNATGIKGLMARSVLPIGTLPRGGTWHNSTTMPAFQWKGDTSSDEVTGHMFAYPMFLDLVAETDAEKKLVYSLLYDIARYITENHFYLIDVTGKHTTWGVWAPEYLNFNQTWYDERGVNTMQILSWMRSAYRVTGDPMFANATKFLIEQNGYAENMVNSKITPPDDDNFSDDELSFLPYYTWMYAGQHPGVAKPIEPAGTEELFQIGMIRTWNYIRAEKPSLWNFIYGTYFWGADPVKQEVDFLLEDAIFNLKRWPMELIDWPISNDYRLDIQFSPYGARNGKRGDILEAFPPDERRCTLWNNDPYSGSGGSGHAEYSGQPWLLPYWLGVFEKFIV